MRACFGIFFFKLGLKPSTRLASVLSAGSVGCFAAAVHPDIYITVRVAGLTHAIAFTVSPTERTMIAAGGPKEVGGVETAFPAAALVDRVIVCLMICAMVACLMIADRVIIE